MALDLLSQYDYPGNVRELENAIERACALCDEDLILPSDLPPQIVDFAKKESASGKEKMPIGQSLDEFMQQQERKYIEATIAQYKARGKRRRACSASAWRAYTGSWS